MSLSAMQHSYNYKGDISITKHTPNTILHGGHNGGSSYRLF